MFGPHGRAVELGEADRAEQNGVCCPAGGERFCRQRIAVLVNGMASERMLFDRDVDRQRGEHTDRGVAHLGADPVAGKGDDAEGH